MKRLNNIPAGWVLLSLPDAASEHEQRVVINLTQMVSVEPVNTTQCPVQARLGFKTRINAQGQDHYVAETMDEVFTAMIEASPTLAPSG